MDHDDKQAGSPGSMFADWMKSAADFWLSAGRAWTPEATGAAKSSAFPAGDFGKMQEGFQTLLNTWQTSASALGSPQTMEAIFKGATASPETAMRMLQTTWDGYFQLYQIWLKKAGKVGETVKPYSFEGLEPGVFKEWTAFYEKELQPFFKAPQVGLTRLNQERTNAALDKFNQMQVAVSEFLHHLNGPVEKSIKAVQEKIEEQAKEGKLSENFKDYYNMWIKSLEGHYMTLYQSPEYIDSMGRALSAVEESKLARDNVLVDLLQFLPIPTNKEMDELYKEFHVLKKTVKEMAKKVKKLELMNKGGLE
jgi:class III poly(R)-hydroxyalkanoic acid synthase PhaE subunit